MLSKLFGWISGGTSSEGKPETYSSTGQESASSGPPVPEKTISLKDHLQQNGSAGARYQSSRNTLETYTSSSNGDIIPRALQSAFEQPQKDKKPFTYFTGGRAPDLSSNPSPKTVRKENPNLAVPTVPRVLPIVSDEELRLEEQRARTPTPSDMPTLSHLQYNSPLPIYSKQNVQEELYRATGQPSSSPQFNIQHSGTYNFLHTGDRLPEQHSARLDEPSSADYPRYRGFVNPNIQSPSFKRLQYVAGLHSETDDEEPIEVRPSAVRSDERKEESVSRGVSFGTNEQPIALGYSDQGQINLTVQKEEMPSAGYTGGPNWSSDGPPIAQYDTSHYDERGRTPDPGFLAKIAEAEKPKVPPPQLPQWARKAEQKHQKWQGYAGGGESERRQEYYQPAPTRTYQQTPIQWSPPTPEPYRHQGQYTITHSYNTAPQRSTTPRARSTTPRARSTEPDAYRSRRTEKEWMKPYVAPNVLDARFTPVSGRTSTSPMFRSYQYSTPTPVPRQESPSYGQYYGQPGGGSYSKRTTSSTYSRHTDSSRPKSPYRITTTYVPQQAPRKQAPVTTVAVREPSWSQRTEPSWSQRTDTSSSRLWQHESDARRRQREMEDEVSRRSVSAGPSSRSPQPQWQPSSGAVTTYTSSGPAVTQRWQDASGASTKTQTQGSYLDPDGNNVSYTKEVYTTSDPGKEFSMLTQEERKVLEEPLQPGVVSRHITTKYYKKSTYTSTTSASTSQTPPSYSYPQRLQIGPGESQY